NLRVFTRVQHYCLGDGLAPCCAFRCIVHGDGRAPTVEFRECIWPYPRPCDGEAGIQFELDRRRPSHARRVTVFVSSEVAAGLTPGPRAVDPFQATLAFLADPAI